MKNYLFVTAFFFTSFLIGCSSEKTAESKTELLPYQDTSLSIDKRVDDLVSRMTLDEKALQMQNAAPAIARLGIPEYDWWNECLHGVARAGEATVFPQAIGLAATFDKDLIFKVADVISTEARAKHHEAVRNNNFKRYTGLTMWSPNINIFRDPRWGRGQETYGEDPYLTAKLAIEFVKGLQGDDPEYLKVVSTPKHFAVHSGPEPLRHTFDAITNETDLYETYLPAFEATVKEGKAWSVMGAYNKYKGEPCCASHFLLQETLRDKWGFDGYVVSDCRAIGDLYLTHKVVETEAEAAAYAVKKGCDLNCGAEYHTLVEAVDKGLITEEEIDVSLKRLMKARFKLGMFDPVEKVKYAQIPYEKNLAPEHRELALEAARKSIVLLKNENNALPLDIKKLKRIAVVGPNANNLSIIKGNYHGTPVRPVTILEGIKQKAGNDVEVIYKQGCNLVIEGAVFELIPEEVFASENKKGIKAEYFNNLEVEGEPILTRTDRDINSNWIHEPVDNLDMDNFSVRWTGQIIPERSGEMTIGLTGDDGYRLFINGEKRIDQWQKQSPTTKSMKIVVEKGKPVDFVVEYFESGGGEEIQFQWGYSADANSDAVLENFSDVDVIIFAGGLSPKLEGEEMPTKYEGFAGGDRTKISLPKVQLEFLQSLNKTRKPVILVLASGSAVAVNYAKEHISAILACWYPGESAGTAVADVIFGDYNPAGRLPVTFYKSVNDLPPFEDYNMKNRTYRYFEKEPLYPFGYGLSYTDFEYSTPEIEKQEIKSNENVKISVKVTNTGKTDGEEVVQLYIKDMDSDISYRPVKELKGFERIFLKAGESKTVNFELTPRDMSLYNPEKDAYMVEPGEFTIMAGGSSLDRDLTKAVLYVGE